MIEQLEKRIPSILLGFFFVCSFFFWWEGGGGEGLILIDGLQLISRDTDNNAAMYNCWWTK